MRKAGHFASILLFIVLSSLISAEAQHDINVIILGTSQDGGYPQAGCQKICCKAVSEGKSQKKYVASIAVIDESKAEVWLVDCSPDFRDQWQMVIEHCAPKIPLLKGIFLTHAHIGHYTGLINLGREVMGWQNMPVYAMPRMKVFLESNGPWSQLVRLKNIELKTLEEGSIVTISEVLTFQPVTVPHRDEFSETVGYAIRGNNSSLLYVPDIDKWDRWNLNLINELSQVDRAYLDATFYSKNELPGRNMEDIPHPLVSETMTLLKGLEIHQREKVFFIHMNHSNPLNYDMSTIYDVEKLSFNVSQQGSIFNIANYQ
jgi:pyrroloquinoline quinone biosynthesis protein B